MGKPSSIAADTEAIVAWQKAAGHRKVILFNALFRAKQGLIRKLTQKAARAEKTAEDLDDLYQAGAIGFQKAIERFDAGRGYSIATYAAWWIKHEVQRVARGGRPIALPRIRLTNAERSAAIVALRENPDVTPESIGIRGAQLEQVRCSFGVRYVSDDTPRGAVSIERKLLSDAGEFDGEQSLDRARAYRALDGIIARARNGATAEDLGLSPEQFAAVQEVLLADATEEKTMSETTTETEQSTVPTRAARPKTKAKAPAKKLAPPKKVAPGPTLREQLAEKLIAIERTKIISRLEMLDDALLQQLLAACT